MPSSSAKAISSRVLPTPEKTILRRHACRERAAQLAFRHHVHAGAEPRQGGKHGLVGVGLDGVADQRVEAGEGLPKTR